MEVQLEKLTASHGSKGRFRIPSPAFYALYAIALAASISIWLLTIRAPLFLDETGTYWHISLGLSKIWSQQDLNFPVYFYILWSVTKIFGTSEIALRIPSFFAMVGAAYLFYRIARELFDRDTALVATILFCIHPIVSFTACYIRSYAFALLATNAAILALLKLRRSQSLRLAALFGFLAASIFYFHYVFGAILPALLLGFFIIKNADRRAMWHQFGVGIAAFALALVPAIPGLHFLFSTAHLHNAEAKTSLAESFSLLLSTFGPGWPLIFAAALVLAAVIAVVTSRKDNPENHIEMWRILFCVSLALIPLLIIFGLSEGASLRLLAARYRLVAVPGIILCWTLLIKRYLFQPVRSLFWIAIVVILAVVQFGSPKSRQPWPTWKYAVAVANKYDPADRTPVLVCSDHIESAYYTMPDNSASVKGSRFFTPLSYYQLNPTVVGLPITLDKQAIRIGTQFLAGATQKHERFLALAHTPSYGTLDWLSQQASANYNIRDLGTYSEIKVLEFTPRTSTTPSTARNWDGHQP